MASNKTSANLASSPFADVGFQARRVPASAALRWLAEGLRDMRAMPALSAGYGLAFALMGAFLVWGLWTLGKPYLILPFAFGFFLVGPALASGLYDAVRRRRAGEQPRVRDVLFAANRNGAQIMMGGTLLMAGMMTWVRMSLLMFMLTFAFQPPPLDRLAADVLTTPQGLQFLALLFCVGGVLAASVYGSAAVTFPLLLDRAGANIADGIITSWRVVVRNPAAMAVWAAVIVALVGIGMATAFIGLAFTMPLLACASWHAYRDLVAD